MFYFRINLKIFNVQMSKIQFGTQLKSCQTGHDITFLLPRMTFLFVAQLGYNLNSIEYPTTMGKNVARPVTVSLFFSQGFTFY